MTKAQLIQTLEPFDNDIQIEILNDKNYKDEPRIFYYFGVEDDDARILFSRYEPNGKYTELKVRG